MALPGASLPAAFFAAIGLLFSGSNCIRKFRLSSADFAWLSLRIFLFRIAISQTK